jgi:predicted nucleic acid-binding protein
LIAGRLKVAHHLSLADALIAAFAMRHQAILVHKDPEMAVLAEFVQLETLPYKR